MTEDVQEKIQTLIKQNEENNKIIKEIEEKLNDKINKIIQQPKKLDRILNPPNCDIFIDPTDSIRIYLYNNYSSDEILSMDKLEEIIKLLGIPNKKVHIGVQPHKLLLHIQFYD